MAKKMWDLDRLMADADAFSVADMIGIPKKRYGSSTYIVCVDGTHSETQTNHCQLFRDGCHCYSCGSNHNVYGMVRSYYENIVGSSLSHDEICELIAETCGGEDNYLIKPVHSEKKRAPFPLTKEELESIGLSTDTRRHKAIVSYSEFKDEEHTEMVDLDGYGKVKLLPPISIYTLYKDDEETFYWLVKNKIAETIEKAREGYKTYKSRTDWLSQALVQVYCDMYNQARAVEQKLFPAKQKAS